MYSCYCRSTKVYRVIMCWACRCMTLWTLMVFTSETSGQEITEHYLSDEDYFLLADEPDLKCFTRMEDKMAKDFTCIFKTRDNSSYDFYYTTDNPPRRTKCQVQVQRSEDGGFLHICIFPRSDIFMFDDIPLEVLDPTKNSSLFTQTVTVEDNILPEPPSKISVKQNEKIGELQVSWQAKCAYTLYYKIRLSFKCMKKNKTEEKIKQGKKKFNETLVDLVPGEDVRVQVSVRCSPSNTGHWSRWSPRVQAVVPQSAEDISLKCYTKDLINITCQWDHESLNNIKTDYKLFYKMGLSEDRGWTKWTECFPQMNWTGQCGFYGDVQNKIRVKLTSPSAPLGRTFYSEDFKLNHIVKTPAPSHLKQNEDKLCINWDSPLPALSSHLQYETSYKPSAEEHWMTISSDGPETTVCLKVSWSSQFKVKVRAKPHGNVYSGQWSDWSSVLTGAATDPVPAQSRIMLLIQCSPVMLLVFALISISLCYKHFSNLKQYFWPPVPNLDKVLQELLSDINQHKWDAPVSAKQLYIETTASVIEVVTKDYDSGLEGTPEQSAGLLSSSDTSYSTVGQEDSGIETELYPDYVALNRNNVILCSKENNYIYEDNKEEDASAEIQQTSPQSSEYLLPSEDLLGGSDFLNHSYLFLAADYKDRKENEQQGQHGNIYTNMPWN